MLLASISQFPSATLLANPSIFELSFASMPISFFHVFPRIVGPCVAQGCFVLLIKVKSKLCSGTTNFIAEYFFLCKISAHVSYLSLTNSLNPSVAHGLSVGRLDFYHMLQGFICH